MKCEPKGLNHNNNSCLPGGDTVASSIYLASVNQDNMTLELPVALLLSVALEVSILSIVTINDNVKAPDNVSQSNKDNEQGREATYQTTIIIEWQLIRKFRVN